MKKEEKFAAEWQRHGIIDGKGVARHSGDSQYIDERRAGQPFIVTSAGISCCDAGHIARVQEEMFENGFCEGGSLNQDRDGKDIIWIIKESRNPL